MVPAALPRPVKPPRRIEGPLYRSGAKVGQFRRPDAFMGVPEAVIEGFRQEYKIPGTKAAFLSSASSSPDLSRCWRLESAFTQSVPERITPFRAQPFQPSPSSVDSLQLQRPLSRDCSTPVIVYSCSWGGGANDPFL